MPVDTEHKMLTAFLQTPAEAESGEPDAVPGFVGFKPWLDQRGRRLYVPDGRIRLSFRTANGPRRVEAVRAVTANPAGTGVDVFVRARTERGWTEWVPAREAAGLPACQEAEVAADLHTFDGYVTPVLREVQLAWQ
jgi:hypothetical protein